MQRLVVEPAVFAELLAVVARDHDQRVLVATALAQAVEETADLPVGMGDLRVVAIARRGAEERLAGMVDICEVRVEVVGPEEEGPLGGTPIEIGEHPIRHLIGGRGEVRVARARERGVEEVEAAVEAVAQPRATSLAHVAARLETVRVQDLGQRRDRAVDRAVEVARRRARAAGGR